MKYRSWSRQVGRVYVAAHSYALNIPPWSS